MFNGLDADGVCEQCRHILESAQETRKHRRLMKKAAQLDWTDLQEIAKMKGVGVLAPPAPIVSDTHRSCSESEHEHLAVTTTSHDAHGTPETAGENHTSATGAGSSGSSEKEPQEA